MRSILLLLLLTGFVACKKNPLFENNSLVGKWILKESFADPGNGSGKWQKADPVNPQYIEFKNDGRLIASPVDMYSADHYKITSDSTMIFMRDSESFSIRYILLKLY
ncbi:MAG: hypothetical protein ABI683_15355 [Ginsengibacter sp.]